MITEIPGEHAGYSSLEVATGEGLVVADHLTGAGLEVAGSDGLTVADHHAGAGFKSAEGVSDGYVDDKIWQPANTTLDDGIKHWQPSWRARRRRCVRAWCWLIGAIILCVVVVAAIVGGVLGSRARSSSSASPANTTSKALLRSTGLAAVAWMDSIAIHHRVYWQDETLQLRESSWDDVQKVRFSQSSVHSMMLMISRLGLHRIHLSGLRGTELHLPQQ